MGLYGDQFKDKVAIVTGAGGGIGQVYAESLAREGAAVVVADINVEGAQKVADGIKGEGGNALAVRVDVSDPRLHQGDGRHRRFPSSVASTTSSTTRRSSGA